MCISDTCPVNLNNGILREGDKVMEGGSGIDVTAAIGALTSLGVLPVITLAAVVGVAAMLYKRFRK